MPTTSRSKPPNRDPGDDAGLPSWFFGMLVVALLVAFLLPYPPVKYLLLAVFGAVFVSFYRDHPERTLYVFILGMPVTDLIPPTLIPIPGINTETLIIVALAYAVVRARRIDPRISGGPNPFIRPVVYYIVVLIFSAFHTMFGGDAWMIVEGSWARIRWWDVFSAIKNQVTFAFLAPIAFRLITTPDRLRMALNLVGFTTILVSLHAAWQIRGEILSGALLAGNRASGLVAGQPNLFGGFLAMMLAIFVTMFISAAVTIRERLLYGGVLATAISAILLTLSRGSWLALMVAMLFLAISRGARVAILLIAIGLSAPLWLPQEVVDRVQQTTDENEAETTGALDDSAQVRVDQWKALPEIMSESPIIGHGFLSFQRIWARVGPYREPKSAHSSIIEFAAEEGLLGLIAYTWLIGTLALAAWRVWRRKEAHPFARDLAPALLGALICLVLLDCSGTRFRNREVMAYIWILGAGISRMAVVRKTSVSADSLARGPVRRWR